MHEKGALIHSEAYWYNPVDKCIYQGEHSADSPNWDKSNIALDINIHEQTQNLLQAGNYNDEVGAATAGYSDEMYNKVVEYLDIQEQFKKGNKNAINDNLAQGGMLDRRDYANVKTLQTESRIVLAKPEAHVLLNIVDRTATNEFSFKWYKIGTPFDAIVKKVSDQQTFHTGSLKYTTDTAALDIYGSEIGWTWEFKNETFDVPILQHHLQNLEGQFDRARNDTVADVINAVSATGGGGDWDALTANVNDDNPIIDLEALSDLVVAADLGSPNTIISNKAVYRAFQKSTPWIVGNTVGIQSPVVNPISYQPTSNYIANTVPIMDGFRWVIDNLITAEEVTVCIPSSIRFWDGPQRTISWMHEQTDEEGTIYKAYWTSKLVETAHFKKYGSILS
jgi:hypothetical protein